MNPLNPNTSLAQQVATQKIKGVGARAADMFGVLNSWNRRGQGLVRV